MSTSRHTTQAVTYPLVCFHVPDPSILSLRHILLGKWYSLKWNILLTGILLSGVDCTSICIMKIRLKEIRRAQSRIEIRKLIYFLIRLSVPIYYWHSAVK